MANQVLEMRYGTLRIRLETARDRLKAWAVDETGTITIDELEEERINPYPHLGLNSLPTLVRLSLACLLGRSCRESEVT
jgi:hypothetical protein